MIKRLLWTFLVAAASASALVSAQSIALIVHQDNQVTSITRTELSKIFLKRLRTWSDGTVAVPVDQLPSSEVRKRFTRLVHRRSVVKVEVYWKRMIFSGRGVPPRERASDHEVLEFVRSTPGAVGYVTRSEELEGVRELKLEE